METTLNSTTAQVITPEILLNHWQGHRALTRRTIEAFPEEAFFNHTIGGMRPFSGMVMELLGIAGPGIKEIATGQSLPLNEHVEHGNKKAKLLELWTKPLRLSMTIGSLLNLNNFKKALSYLGNMKAPCNRLSFIL